ncbi:MAG: hypothetical protein H7Y39_02255 [Nitrospiraceae bacterium]|nr:hypothetical protein [Nitrospiraceae bacterium]
MRFEDVKKIDWKQDPDLLAVERKMAGLAERETKERARLEALGHIVRDAEESLVQCRAAMLLNEPTKETEKAIQQRLNSARLEISEIEGGLVALKIAQNRLGPTVEAAAEEARLRVAASLLAPYRQTVSNLKALLTKAAEENRVLHEIHNLAVRQQLARELGGNKALKPLTMLLAWNFLTHPNGTDAGEFQYWKKYVDSIVGDD